jgi:hypothetical protein
MFCIQVLTSRLHEIHCFVDDMSAFKLRISLEICELSVCCQSAIQENRTNVRYKTLPIVRDKKVFSVENILSD